ncbi:hypothetical protein H6P81_002649 [Aristolochia fimbriata]|uniref:Uncharacterized protein n=1 Tax=Aristolochia fimbriata TaxID=158543 RepID=A0AAV7FDJ6_ARIFI|nr:hypothetical protein H6P81_002649 [Aristolochia fimbriata]
MAAPSVTLTCGLHAFDHAVTVKGEPLLTLALYIEGEVSRIIYCPSGKSVFGHHAVKCPPLVNRSLSQGSLSTPLAIGERILFISCSDSSCKDVAAGPQTFALQSALHSVNQSPLPWTLADDFMDAGVRRNPHLPDVNLDAPLPFLFEWTTLILGR